MCRSQCPSGVRMAQGAGWCRGGCWLPCAHSCWRFRVCRMCRAANYPLLLWKSSFPNGPAAARCEAVPAGHCRAPTTCDCSGSCAIVVPAHPASRDPPVALQVRGTLLTLLRVQRPWEVWEPHPQPSWSTSCPENVGCRVQPEFASATGGSSGSWAKLGSLVNLAGLGSLPRASQCQPCCPGRESSPGVAARQEQLFLL